MVDLTFSYDYQIILNGGATIGILHSFSPDMLSLRFKGVEFEIKKRKLGHSMYNFKLV